MISGQIDFKKLNTNLSETDYAIGKVGVWVRMLNKGERPKKWLKARKGGTKVNFEIIQSETDFENGLNELKGYLAEIKNNHGLEITLKGVD